MNRQTLPSLGLAVNAQNYCMWCYFDFFSPLLFKINLFAKVSFSKDIKMLVQKQLLHETKT